MYSARRQHRLSRRTVLGFGAAAGLLPAAAWGQGEPVRVGFLTVNTGPLAAGGKQMEEGLTFFLRERNHALAGRTIEVITADTAGQPATAKIKAQELVERNQVAVVIGPLATYEALAIEDYLGQAHVPLITPTSAASIDTRQRQPNPWVVHAVGTAPQVTHPLGEYAAKTLQYKRVATIADDFTYGHEGVGGFQRTFEDNGGKVVQKLWPPLSATDYGTFIAQIKRDVDAVYIGFAGVNGLRFLKAFADYGLHGKIPVLGNTTSTDEGILRVMGDEALGVVTAGWYAAGLQTPDNFRFVDGIRSNYGGHDPGFYTAGTYTAGLFLEAALTALKGDASNPEALLQTLRGTRLTAGPIGPIRLDPFGTPILDVHIRKVERRNGRLINAIVTTYHDVSQFWTYNPQQFMEQPVYSRDYPPAKNLE